MSSITQMSIRGLKVAEMAVHLTRLNLVVGRVGSGKSSVVDAIQFGALGTVPRVGLSNALTAKLVRGDEAEVSIEFEHKGEEQSFTRRLFRDGASWKQSASASWLPPRTKPDEVGEKLTRCFGATDTEAAQNLDITRLLAASSGELAATVEKLLDAAGMSPDAIEAEVRRIFGGRIETLRPNVDGVIGPLSESVTSIAPGILAQIIDRARRSIAEAILWARDRKNAAASEEREANSADKTARTRLAELKAPAEASADLRTRRQAAHARAEEIGTTLKLYRSGADARAKAATELDRSRAAAEQAAEVLRIRKEAAARVPELRAAVEGLRGPAMPEIPAVVAVDQRAMDEETKPLHVALEALTEPKQPADCVKLVAGARDDAIEAAGPETYDRWLDAAAESERAHNAARAAGERPLPVVPSIDAERTALRTAERELAKADQSPWRAVESIVSNMESMLSGFEQYPDAKPYIKALRELAQAHGGERTTFEGAVLRAKEALAQATLLREAATAEVEAAKEEVRKLAAAATEASDHANRLRRVIEDAVAAENAKRSNATLAAIAAYNTARDAHRAEQSRLRGLVTAAEQKHRAKAEDENARHRSAYETEMEAFRARAAEVEADREAKLKEIQRLEADERVAARVAAEAEKAHTAAAAAISGSAEALTVDEAAIEAEQNALISKLDQLDAQLSVVGRAEALREELARFVAAAEAAAAVRDVYSAAEWTLSRVRDEDLRTRAGALEGPMRRFLAPVVDAGEPMVRAEKGKVQLGLRYGERFVDAAALSGGQAALFRAALGFAQIVARAPVLRVLHIELAEACDGVLEDQILRACEAVSEEVQVVVTTCVPIAEPDAARGWNVIRVEREAATTAA